MKKIVITLILLIFSSNVYAAECTESDKTTANNALENLTYNLEYNENYTDMNGNEVDGYFNISFPNLPSGYKIKLDTYEAEYELKSPSDIGYASGGVVKADVYSNTCEGVVKIFEFKVPFYKQNYLFGNLNDEDVWFDGTTENIGNSDNKEQTKSILSLRLLIILIVLIIAIVGIVVYIIRKRRLDEENI